MGVSHVASQYETERARPLRIGALAGRQHGVVALSQLRALGLSAEGVRSRVARGSLYRLHRGVYAVGHAAVSGEGRWLAAVLACGPDALLSHRSAAGLWGLRPDNRRAIDVTVPRRSTRGRRGIDVHSAVTIRPEDTTTLHSIPCTGVARTLLDLAECVDRRGLARAVERAEQLRIFDLTEVEAVLAEGRRPACRSSPPRRYRRLPARGEMANASSSCRFLALCTDAGLPRPLVNGTVSGPPGRLPLAGPAPHRRDRRPRDPRHEDRVRGRPPARSAADGRRLARGPLHLAAGGRGAARSGVHAAGSAHGPRLQRRGRDSNPRGRLTPPTRFPVALLKPLGHLSFAAEG